MALLAAAFWWGSLTVTGFVTVPLLFTHLPTPAMAGNMARANVHLDQATLVRRVLGNNASIVRRPLLRKLWSRVIFTVSYLDLWLRLRRA